MDNQFKIIKCEDIQIAVSIEANSSEEHSAYFPSNLLFYISQGQLNIKLNQELRSFGKGSFILVRKYTTGQHFKTWEQHEDGAIMYAFILQDDFIKTALKELNITIPNTNIDKRIIQLQENTILKGLMDSIVTYFQDDSNLDKQLVALKTKEAILAILKSNPEYAAIFAEFSISERANLVDFMNHNYLYKISLSELAKMSGRSLSTFHREFKLLFNTSPHKWIMKKRLETAKQMLLQKNQKISAVYMQVGFEDLAHFSRAFKKEFGKTPSEFRNAVH